MPARTYNRAVLPSSKLNNVNECTEYLTSTWHHVSHAHCLYSYNVSHTNTQGSPQRNWRPRGRQATRAIRTCSIYCARPPTSAAPHGSLASRQCLRPQPYTPRSARLSPEHITLEITLQFIDFYAHHTPFGLVQLTATN